MASNTIEEPNMELYGFSGKIGSGKNYVSEKIFIPLLSNKQTLVMALADHFKVDACAKDGLDYDRVFVNKDEESRRILQLRGTEEGRNKYGDDVWIRTLETWMRVYFDRGIRRVIVTDVRFENEAEWIKKIGGTLVRIVAPERTHARMAQEATSPDAYDRIKNHVSETALDMYTKFDHVIQNDPQDDAVEQVKLIVKGTCDFRFSSVESDSESD